jgi:3',5'-cyclic AMP phosphodiesterase CpdA
MRIVHLSDLHAAARPDSLSAFFDKRLVGTLNHLFRRRFLHDQSLLKQLGAFVLELKPDVVVITGDVTSTGQPAEFAVALDALQPILNDEKVATLYVPGNHDAYVRNERCAASLAETFRVLNSSGATLSSLPLLQTISGVDFILVDETSPTNIFLSNGRVSQKSLNAIERICADVKKRPRVLVGHFPLKPKLSFRHGLVNQHRLNTLLEKGDIDLSLCGHTHKSMLEVDAAGRGEAVAGSFTKTRDVNIVDYSPEIDRFTVRTETLENHI